MHPTARIPGPSVDWIPFLGNMREIIREEVRKRTIIGTKLHRVLTRHGFLEWSATQEMVEKVWRHCRLSYAMEQATRNGLGPESFEGGIDAPCL